MNTDVFQNLQIHYTCWQIIAKLDNLHRKWRNKWYDVILYTEYVNFLHFLLILGLGLFVYFMIDLLEFFLVQLRLWIKGP